MPVPLYHNIDTSPFQPPDADGQLRQYAFYIGQLHVLLNRLNFVPTCLAHTLSHWNFYSHLQPTASRASGTSYFLGTPSSTVLSSGIMHLVHWAIGHLGLEPVKQPLPNSVISMNLNTVLPSDTLWPEGHQIRH